LEIVQVLKRMRNLWCIADTTTPVVQKCLSKSKSHCLADGASDLY